MAFRPKRYAIDLTVAFALYAGVLVATRLALQSLDVTGPLRGLLASAPVIPTVLTIAVLYRHFLSMDEMFKRLHLQAFSASALIVGLVAFALGFLEDAGLERPSPIWALPAMIAGWGVLGGLMTRRFRE